MNMMMRARIIEFTLIGSLTILLFFSGSAANAFYQRGCEKEKNQDIANASGAEVNGAPPGCFDNYVFAYAWLPTWCYTSATQNQSPDCLDIAKGRGLLAYNLAIHGLWPNYKVDSTGHSHYPVYCYNGSPGCQPGDTICILQAPLVTGPSLARYQMLVPDWLIMHEWEKHGTCSGKKQDEYIKDILKYYNKLRTPYIIYSNIGKNVTLNDLQNAYPKSVSIQCSQANDKQLLSEIYTYWSKEGHMIDRPSDAASNCDPARPIYITSYSDL